MKYTVVWQPPAERHLTDLWVSAPDRAEVTEAANRIEAILRNNPYSFSESRAGLSRVMIVSPLGVGFDVSEDDRLVTVWGVWHTQ